MGSQKEVIFITGASSGFGKVIATTLAEQGYIVYGTSRKPLDSTGKIRMLVMDVTQPTSIEQAVNTILSEQGKIDVLINNAGMGISGAIELATEEEIHRQIGTNFLGMARMCSAVLPYMRKARKGKIINISSIGGIIAVPFQGFYCASKFAIEGYSEALAQELHSFHIKVCLVEPGDFNTNFTANRNISIQTTQDGDYKESFARVLKAIEQAERKGCKPEKLGRVVSKLVQSNNPPFRTLVGPWEQVLFAKCKKFLPAKWMQHLICYFYKV